MPFLVFEQDPLVRADICETLAEEFADQLIASFETIKSAWRDNLSVSDGYVVVLSGPTANANSSIEAIGKILPSAKFLLIGDDDSFVDETRDGHKYLQKPFSSMTLLASIKSVLYNPLEKGS